jgi:hypothetical protein
VGATRLGVSGGGVDVGEYAQTRADRGMLLELTSELDGFARRSVCRAPLPTIELRRGKQSQRLWQDGERLRPPRDVDRAARQPSSLGVVSAHVSAPADPKDLQRCFVESPSRFRRLERALEPVMSTHVSGHRRRREESLGNEELSERVAVRHQLREPRCGVRGEPPADLQTRADRVREQLGRTRRIIVLQKLSRLDEQVERCLLVVAVRGDAATAREQLCARRGRGALRKPLGHERIRF